MRTKTAHDVFHYLRGAIRSAYGIEDFRQIDFLVIGMCKESQNLLSLLCFEGVDVKYLSDIESMSSYQKAFTLCNSVDIIEKDEDLCFDVMVHFSGGLGAVNGEVFNINDIGEKPYEQGIHDYYMM